MSPLLDGEMQAIEVGSAKTTLRHFEKMCVFKFFQIRAHAALSGAHINCKFLLPGKAGVIGPGVFQEHGVSELGADAQVLVGQDEIWNLCKTHNASPDRHR